MMREIKRAQSGGAKVKIAAFVVLVMAVLAMMLTCVVRRARRDTLRIRCVGNLCRLAKGVHVYLYELGNDEWYPCALGRGADPTDYNGAEWLASLYWTGVSDYPYDYLCPATNDSNAGGRHLGKERAAPDFGPETVSYAGMHWRSLSPEGSPIPDDYPNRPATEEPMVSDDTQATVNHAPGPWHGMNVLFFDGHVAWKTAEELNPETAVGKPGGLLEKLRN